MNLDHPDFPIVNRIVTEIQRLSGGNESLKSGFPVLVQDAVDFVIDPVRTARTKISDLDNVEKTFIGLKIEHFLRDFLGVPKGLRDLRIDGLDVDVKNTVSKSWMIPPETFSNTEPCVLVMVATATHKCSLGVFVARPEYLNAGNRDGKRSVSASAFQNIWWILRDESLPESRFAGIDMARFRELRELRGGSKRAAQFFRENLGHVVHRSVIQGLLFDQDDYMKRLRGNGGARDILVHEQIAILSGAYHSQVFKKFSIFQCDRQSFCAVSYGKEKIPVLNAVGFFSKPNR
jgi:Restriction endonuclease NaeI